MRPLHHSFESPGHFAAATYKQLEEVIGTGLKISETHSTFDAALVANVAGFKTHTNEKNRQLLDCRSIDECQNSSRQKQSGNDTGMHAATNTQ